MQDGGYLQLRCKVRGYRLMVRGYRVMGCDRYAAGVWVVADRKLRSACMRL